MRLGRLARALLLLPLAAAAQEPVRPEAPRQSAPVVIANRTVITLRGPIAGYSAEERVRNATDRIEAALDADPYAQIAFDDSEAGTRVLPWNEHTNEYEVPVSPVGNAGGENASRKIRRQHRKPDTVRARAAQASCRGGARSHPR